MHQGGELGRGDLRHIQHALKLQRWAQGAAAQAAALAARSTWPGGPGFALRGRWDAAREWRSPAPAKQRSEGGFPQCHGGLGLLQASAGSCCLPRQRRFVQGAPGSCPPQSFWPPLSSFAGAIAAEQLEPLEGGQSWKGSGIAAGRAGR